MHTRRTALHFTATLCALGLAGPALAQSQYPDHPVKVIVALSAGGSVDMIARTLSQKLNASLGQPFVVDNRAGASGQIGMPAVAKAPADGYTLVVSPASFLTTNKSIFKTLPYDPEADFTPVSRLVNQPMVLVVKDKQKFPTVAALMAAAKAAPGQVTYASSGDGSPQHLAGLMFETRTQARLLHVPYKGGAPAVNDTLAGSVDAMFAVMPEAIAHIQSGKLHALGVMSPQRSAVLPNTPTMVESGFADMNLSAWIGLLAPAKTPRAVVNKLNGEVRKIMAQPDVAERMVKLGAEPMPMTPERFDAYIKEEFTTLGAIMKAAPK